MIGIFHRQALEYRQYRLPPQRCRHTDKLEVVTHIGAHRKRALSVGVRGECRLDFLAKSAGRHRGKCSLNGCDSQVAAFGASLPNLLTFEFKVRAQVALFSPHALPNLLTYGFWLPARSGAMC